MSRRLAPAALAALVLASGALSGCTSFELARTRNDLAREVPEARLGPGYSLSFGGVSLGLARFFTRFGDEAATSAALAHVRRVSVGFYPVEGHLDAGRVRMPRRLRDLVERGGWEHLATFRDGTEAGWIVYRERDDDVTDLFAVIFQEDELLMARLRGNLSDVVRAVLQDRLRDDRPLLEDGLLRDEAAATDTAAALLAP